MTAPAPNPSPAPVPPARPQIGLIAQLLTCLGFCIVAAPIIWLQADPRAALAGTMPLMWQMLVGQGLALVAALVSYIVFRMTANSASTARTIESYARLDLRGLNPLWISIAAAIGEEMLFRAALQPFLGVWIVSLLFLVTHVPVYRFRKLDRATLAQAAGIVRVQRGAGLRVPVCGAGGGDPGAFVDRRRGAGHRAQRDPGARQMM
jgi:membrane protease YdiL (CAAX protease family)